ncbi:uncharacterized protein unc [Drosophila takahashii]|uniref:uncharacterized protein unc n=1 Tax=Drosophila takahashii TaxID=29030 RepID=UPI0038995B45
MKTRQLPATTTTVSFRAKQRDVVGGMSRLGMPCERERKHEAAKREREEREEQLKRDKATAAAAAAAQRVRLHNRRTGVGGVDGDLGKPRRNPYLKGIVQRAAGLGGAPNVTGVRTGKFANRAVNASEDRKDEQDEYDVKADRLRQQLEELAAMSEQEFEVKFRQWLDQEGIAREMHSHLRVELIHCFNNTALGQLLSKAAGVQMAHSHALLLSPLAMILHTLVAEFLHSQNCHFTLSVFCSETPHRHKLPDFSRRPEFRFRQEELQQVLTAVLGGEDSPEDPEFNQLVVSHYEEDLAGQTQCLLMALLRSLVEIRTRNSEKEKEEVIPVISTIPASLQDSACQTEPMHSPFLAAHSEVDTSNLYQAEEHELILGADGRSVFVGGRVSQSLHSVEQQLSQLMRNLRQLAKSCAPPIEVISAARFENLLQKELAERERLLKAGQAFDPSETVTKLAKPVEEKEEEQPAGPRDEVVQSDVGPIQLPVLDVAIPRLPYLQSEQLASLAVIRQSLEKVQRKARQPQGRMYVSMERMENLMGDIATCVQLLGNVLNLSMEQEHAVGLHKGFKTGYREGFAHGHFMGLQEGQKQEQFDQRKRERERQRREIGTQVEVRRPTVHCRGSQTSRRSTHLANSHTQTKEKNLKDAANQANLLLEPSQKSYEQWIHEMLHSSSGQVFLERVELSLKKALELQKERLDELFQVKLRHQAEMLRLSRRQNSWRTLCKRVERDSQSSTEARDLVQKIFRLLEHYESHHQQLAEKIQQTEIAAEQAARILPLWAEEQGQGVDGNAAPGNWNSAMSTTPTSSGMRTPAPPDPPAPPATAPAPPLERLGYPYQLLALGPPGGIPVAGAFVSVNPRLSVHFARDLEQPPRSRPTVPPEKPSDTKPSTPRNDNIPREPAAPKVPPVPAPRDPKPSPEVSALPSNASISDVPPAPSDPPKPSMHSVATNTMAPPAVPPKMTPLKQSSRQSPTGPSFEEALLSAKNRMLQLEQESDLLEQSFLSYLEKAKSKSGAPKGGATEEASSASIRSRRIRSSCLRERDQMNRTLDGFRDWHRRVRKEDAASLAQLEELQQQRIIPEPKVSSSPLWLSELEEGHEPDSYPFTNAISEARSKLLGKIMPEEQAKDKKKQVDWLPTEVPVPEVLDPVKPPELNRLLAEITPDLTRSSSNGEMSLLLQRAKDALGMNNNNNKATHRLLDDSSSSSSSSSSSLELPSRSPSTKLQQSMAKMQLLFGGAVDPAKPIPARRTGRPVSAPTSGLESGLRDHLTLPQRPHTAPTLQAISEQNESPILQLDVSTSSSSQRTAGEAFEDLVTSAVKPMHHESSPEVSYSQAFWKRMNL